MGGLPHTQLAGICHPQLHATAMCGFRTSCSPETFCEVCVLDFVISTRAQHAHGGAQGPIRCRIVRISSTLEKRVNPINPLPAQMNGTIAPPAHCA